MCDANVKIKGALVDWFGRFMFKSLKNSNFVVSCSQSTPESVFS